jgi:hypothetical protein
VLYGVFMWEWIAGLERDWKIFESKDEWYTSFRSYKDM